MEKHIKHKLFDEELYLSLNEDIRASVKKRQFESGWHHYITFGFMENRKGVNAGVSEAVRTIKGTRIFQIYSGYRCPEVSYSTVADFSDSLDNLPNLIFQGDMKDVARPWALKAIVSNLKRGAKLLEIGAGEPVLAQFLHDLGYDVTIVDPYDGSGNGPTEYDYYKRRYPELRFVRALFGKDLKMLREGEFDCIYSVSVLEHISIDHLSGIFNGTRKYLTKGGYSIHTVDFVAKGKDDSFSARHLRRILIENEVLTDVQHLKKAILEDDDTYFLSAEAHLKWKRNAPYADYPYRKVTSVHICKKLKNTG